MAWSEATLEALRKWIRVTTWATWHWADEGRFYEFILAVWVEERALWDQATALEIMLREAKNFHPTQGDDYIRQNIDNAKRAGTRILDFLSHLEKKGQLAQISL